MTFAEKLRQARKAKGLTQAELAKSAGLSVRTIICYEQGSAYPRYRKTYSALAEVLGVDADYLHNENDDFIADAQAAHGTRGRRQAQELMSEVTGLFAGGDLSEEDKDEFLRAVQEAYWESKKSAREKFTRKDYRKKKDEPQ
jgi:transcriptional regulator with XRE-family HTH domain